MDTSWEGRGAGKRILGQCRGGWRRDGTGSWWGGREIFTCSITPPQPAVLLPCSHCRRPTQCLPTHMAHPHTRSQCAPHTYNDPPTLTVQANHSEEDEEHGPVMRPDEAEAVGEQGLPQPGCEESVKKIWCGAEGSCGQKNRSNWVMGDSQGLCMHPRS